MWDGDRSTATSYRSLGANELVCANKWQRYSSRQLILELLSSMQSAVGMRQYGQCDMSTWTTTNMPMKQGKMCRVAKATTAVAIIVIILNVLSAWAFGLCLQTQPDYGIAKKYTWNGTAFIAD